MNLIILKQFNVKRIIPFHLLFVLLSGCSSLNKDQTVLFIPGTYVRSEVNEFGRVEDTIKITIQHREVNSFLIEQRWRYERVIDGVRQEPEYKVIADQGIYDPERKLLQNQRNLLLYSFGIKDRTLYFGVFTFKKIN